MEHAKYLGCHEKTKPMNAEGEEIQTKGTDNLFNRIITENVPNFEKERVTQVQEAHRAPFIRTKKETPLDTS
jgi:hypothetical protein